MPLVSSSKLQNIKKALRQGTQRKFFIQTFGCQMNYADSEKIHMLLAQAGLQRVDSWEDADIVLFNTCSVRQKGEDRVFSYMEDIAQFCRKTGKDIKIGLTGCMTRKTGINKKYYEYEGRKNTTKISLSLTHSSLTPTLSKGEGAGADTPSLGGGNGEAIAVLPPPLEGVGERPSLFNSDDSLFIRTDRIDFIVRIEEIGALTTILSILYDEDIGQDDAFQSYLQIAQARENPASANVIIQTGCDNYCTFCIVPYTRGHEVSRPMDDILHECEEAVLQGAREIVLLGQNVNSYGKEFKKAMWDEKELVWKAPFCKGGCPTIGGQGDCEPNPQSGDTGCSSPDSSFTKGASDSEPPFVKGDDEGVNLTQREARGGGIFPENSITKGAFVTTPFRDLLDALNTLDGLDRIRFTSSNPHDMTRDILDAHFDLERCCHYLHFALQSGDNTILKSMNRKHTYEQFRDMVSYLRSRDPLFGISTDIIVGFPGETDEQFENTVLAFKECQFDFAYIARYSPRNLTYASKMPNQVPSEVKAYRWDRLNTLMFEIIQSRNQLMIGREEVILVSKIDPENGDISGRTRNFKEVFISRNPSIKIGDLIPVRIRAIDRWVLRGEIIS